MINIICFCVIWLGLAILIGLLIGKIAKEPICSKCNTLPCLCRKEKQ